MVGTHKVLQALDSAKTQWYHFTTILIAGMGFFTDAYDLFCISTVTRLLGRLYYYDPEAGTPGVLPANVSAAVNSVALCGTLAGQLFFGWLGDKMGRKKVYGITLLLMIFSSLGSSLSWGHSAKAVMWSLCFWRFWLGFGIGGDYPLSATIMSEYANKATRGAFIAAVFAMQGVGIIAAASVAIVVSSAYRRAYPSPSFDQNQVLSTPPEADYVWRIVFGLGAIPAALTFYYRMKMPETARYTALVEGNLRQAAADMAKVLDVSFPEAEMPDDDQLDALRMEQFHRRLQIAASGGRYGINSREFLRRHGLELLGCCSTWFLLDVAFYSQNLFQKDVFSAVGWLPRAGSMSALEEVFRISKAQAVIALVSTVPGYWCTVATVEKLGRKVIQLLGFFMMTLFMFLITLNYDELTCGNTGAGSASERSKCGGSSAAFLFLYSLTFFFANFGPNATTFIIPAELFPARLRSTCHGISAASGKLGAIVGSFGFLYASQQKNSPEPGFPHGIGIKNALLLLAVTNTVGLLCTIFFVPETKGKSLEELSGEAELMDVSKAAVVPAPADVHFPVPTISVQRRTHDGHFQTHDGHLQI